MGIIKIGNFKIVWNKGDYSPEHMHIFYRGKELGRFDIEHRRPLDKKLILTNKLKKVLKKAGYLK